MITVGNVSLMEKDEIIDACTDFSYEKFFESVNEQYGEECGACAIITGKQYLAMKNVNNGKGSHNLSFANILYNINEKAKAMINGFPNPRNMCSVIRTVFPNVYILMRNEAERFIEYEFSSVISSDVYEMFKKYCDDYADEINALDDVSIGVLIPASGGFDSYDVESVEDILSIIEPYVAESMHSNCENEIDLGVSNHSSRSV